MFHIKYFINSDSLQLGFCDYQIENDKRRKWLSQKGASADDLGRKSPIFQKAHMEVPGGPPGQQNPAFDDIHTRVDK